jgi:thiol-disulfide isomerase/thioredoxin
MRGRGSISRLAVLAVLLAAGAVPAVRAQASGLQGFQTIGDYLLKVGGEGVPGARIYALRQPPAILIMTSRFASPVLLRPSDGAVVSVQLLKVAQRDDGTIDLLPGYPLGSEGTFQVEGLEVHFSVGGVEASLGPQPPLLGLQPIEELRAHDPDYARKETAYEPSKPIVEQLRQRTQETRVRVFFGSWCPHCAEMVPRIMKVAEALKGSKLKVEFYGLPRDFGDEQVSRYHIDSVPTGIVFVDGKEIGRISGNSWKLPELALNNLLVGG